MEFMAGVFFFFFLFYWLICFFDLSQSLKCRVHSLLWPVAVAHFSLQPQESFASNCAKEKRFSYRGFWVDELKNKTKERKLLWIKTKKKAFAHFCTASHFPLRVHHDARLCFCFL